MEEKEFFTCQSLHRQDLYEVLGKERADSLDDATMQNIADKIGEMGMETFWLCVEEVPELLKEG